MFNYGQLEGLHATIYLDTKSPQGITPLSVKHGFISRKSRVSSSHHVVARDVATHARVHQRPEKNAAGW